jgi:flavin reductase (DIM6/NTAB) family NADH-FMN oxidoreductase RutF
METGPRQTIVIGRIVCAHIDDAFVQDEERCYIDTPSLRLIGRMHGSGWYARCTDLFQMDRPTWAEWRHNGAARLASGKAP